MRLLVGIVLFFVFIGVMRSLSEDRPATGVSTSTVVKKKTFHELCRKYRGDASKFVDEVSDIADTMQDDMYRLLLSRGLSCEQMLQVRGAILSDKYGYKSEEEVWDLCMGVAQVRFLDYQTLRPFSAERCVIAWLHVPWDQWSAIPRIGS